MVRELAGRRMLVTGASRGIGRSLAEQAAAAGARLALTARSADELETLAAPLRQAGADVHLSPADLTLPADRDRVVAGAVAALGGLDVLVNNAGLASFGEFTDSTEAVLRQVMEINFFAPAEMIRLAVPHLQRGNRPAVVNVASVCGRRGIPTWPEHSASKFALVGLTECLRAEFARFDIDVLLVLPGLTRADDLGRHLVRNAGRLRLDFAGAQPPEKVARIILRALRRNWTETVVGWQARWVVRGQQLLPRLMDWILASKMRRDSR
jgi:short-subunit dehydrogenase